MTSITLGPCTLIHGDCLELMRDIPPRSVDLILCDLPYGTTQNKWDCIIPLVPLWAQYKRLAKGAIVLTAAQPFTSILVCSNLPMFKYGWTWDKVNRISGHLNAKKQPLRITEEVAVFYDSQPTYNPQMEKGEPYTAVSKGRKSECYGSQVDEVRTVNTGEYFPRNLISIKADQRGSEGRVHPTQKPVALMEYLIRTYTNEGDTVLDNCFGSGTTGIACLNTGRKFIGIEQDDGYFKTAVERVRKELAQGQLL